MHSKIGQMVTVGLKYFEGCIIPSVDTLMEEKCFVQKHLYCSALYIKHFSTMFHKINDTFVTHKSVSRISNHWWIQYCIQFSTKQRNSHTHTHTVFHTCWVTIIYLGCWQDRKNICTYECRSTSDILIDYKEMCLFMLWVSVM